ncbi:MAG: TrmH family RNA methyltransferase [Chloroflexia bacterium]
MSTWGRLQNRRRGGRVRAGVYRINPLPAQRDDTRRRQGAHRRVPWRYEETAADEITSLRSRGYTAFALETTPDARPYHEVEYPDKVCLIVGNEHHGVTKRTLEACDAAIYIPMFGKMQSLNVHVALAVVAYHCLVGSSRA